jgi:hypothetical protein
MHQYRRVNRGHCLRGQRTLVVLLFQLCTSCLFKVGQLISFRYTLVQATCREDALMQIKVMLTSESVDVISIVYS